ncbi:MAG: ABC transporter substrate-binding protein [Xanthobacteraceae bacterium]
MNTINRRCFNGMMLALLTPGVATAQESPTLRIAHDTPIAWLPFYIAYEKKFWQAKGVNPVIVPSLHGTATLIAVSAGGADCGVSTDLSVSIGAFNKTTAKILASFNRVENMELVAVKDIKSPADLKGRRIAIVQANPSHYYFSLLLTKYGIRPSELNIVRLGPPEMISALNGGAIDGFVWQEPFLTQATRLSGDRFHRLAEPGLNAIHASLIANDTAIKAQRPVLVNALRALDEACAYIRANPDEAVSIGAKYSQMDPTIAADAISRMQIGLTNDVPVLKAIMTEEAKWAIAEGIVRPNSSIPDYADYLDATLLAEARNS